MTDKNNNQYFRMGVLSLTIAFIMILMASQQASGCEKETALNCLDLQKQGHFEDGIYTIYPYGRCPDLPVEVFCDMTTDGGGWTVIQRRKDILPRENFSRSWLEYAKGFGDMLGEFWLGNDHIHALTNQTNHQIRFDMADFDDNTRYAVYRSFHVNDRDSYYMLEVSDYTGNAGNAFETVDGMKFSAKDKDWDREDRCFSCRFKGGWWYNRYHSANPNGVYLAGPHESYADGINWKPFRGNYYSLKNIDMKIKQAD